MSADHRLLEVLDGSARRGGRTELARQLEASITSGDLRQEDLDLARASAADTPRRLSPAAEALAWAWAGTLDPDRRTVPPV